MNTSRERWLAIIDGLPTLLRQAPDRLTGKTHVVITLDITDTEEGGPNFRMTLGPNDPPTVPNIPEHAEAGGIVNVPVLGPTDLHVKNIGPEGDELFIQQRPGGQFTFKPGELFFPIDLHTPEPASGPGPTAAQLDLDHLIQPGYVSGRISGVGKSPNITEIKKRWFVHLESRKGRYGTFEGDTREAAFKQAWDKNEDEIQDIIDGDMDDKTAEALLKAEGAEAVVRWWWLGPNLEQMEFGQDIEVEER